ncbi:MAG: serine hydrolase, partial [Candidatus Cryptobacteroides sp.]
VASINGKPGIEDILTPESVEAMTWCRRKEDYAIGWNETNPKKGWIRTGTLAGTNAVIKCFPDGECWIFLSNTSTWKGPMHLRYTSQLFDKLRKDYSGKIPARNLFEI